MKKTGNNNKLDTENAIPLKYLSNLWRSLDCSRYCIRSEVLMTVVIVANTAVFSPTAAAVLISVTRRTFQMNSTNLSLPIVTLSKTNYIKYS